MKTIGVLMLCASFILPGCAARRPSRPDLSEGLSQREVLTLWNQPQERAFIGKTPRTHYPVEVWAYYDTRKGKKAGDEYLLLFVDGELFTWSKNAPEVILQQLAQLDIQRPQPEQSGVLEYQRLLRETAEQAEQTRRIMDMLRTFQNYENTRLQIESYNQMRILQQQQMRPGLPPPVQPERPTQQR